MKLPVRAMAIALSAAVATVGLVGCGGASEGPQTAASEGSQTAASEGSQTARIGRTTDLTSTSAFETGSTNQDVITLLYDPLVKLESDGSVTPMLAESLEWNEDYTSLTLGMREGVVFHDGSDFTSADVLYSLERWLSGELTGPVTAMMKDVTSVTAPDASTVVITFATTSPTFTDTINIIYIAKDGDAEGLTGNGTGAYSLVDWAQGSTITLERFDDYWDTTVDGVETIEFQILPDAQALALNLESGAIDIAEDLRTRDIARLVESDAFEVSRFTRFMFYITFNVGNAPFDDVRVRQAISYAIDRDRIADEVFSGIATASSWPWPPDSPLWDDAAAQAYPFDLDKARGLLDEAGLDTVDAQLVTPNNFPVIGEFAQIIQADLAKIGVTLDVQNVDFVQWKEMATTEQGWPGILAGPAGRVNVDPVSALVARPYHPTGNLGGFRDDNYTNLISEALTETDTNARFELAREAGRLVQEEAFTVPVVTAEATLTFRSGVTGLSWRQDFGQVLNDIHLP